MDAPFAAFRRLHRAGEPCVFFDGTPDAANTEAERALRTWSFAAVAPSAGLCVREGRAFVWQQGDDWVSRPGDPWGLLRAFIAGASGDAPAGVPFPFGVAGLVTYDAGRLIEKLPASARDDTFLPEILVFRFDAAVAIPARGELVIHHRPGCEAAAASLRERLAAPFDDAELSPPPAGAAPIVSHTSRQDFESMVTRAKHHVREGDVFQVNLSHRLETRTRLAPLALYARLRDANPAPFSAYFESGALPMGVTPFEVLSSSPERLFRSTSGRLEARPIAGTRRRGATPEDDARLVAELRADPKEQAEHVMLVDLARNDLGRVAKFGSVDVPHLLTVETYRTVHHLVSVVEADLDAGKDVVDALVALFPGGTITGAPKVRAMEIIEEIEPVRRGVYTGSLGWFGPTGDADLNILIRTLLTQRAPGGDGSIVHLQVGAGIVEDSEPEREYQETLAKAQGLLRALRDAEAHP